jgi:hypothetical protein
LDAGAIALSNNREEALNFRDPRSRSLTQTSRSNFVEKHRIVIGGTSPLDAPRHWPHAKAILGGRTQQWSLDHVAIDAYSRDRFVRGR